MTTDCRIIEITPSALEHGRINIRSCGPEFFPETAFGQSGRKKGLGALLRLHVKGIAHPVMTDIPTDISGRPRWFFRERAWVKDFLKLHDLMAGSKIRIRRLSPSEYEIEPLVASSTGQQVFAEFCREPSPGSERTRTLSTMHDAGANGRRGKNGDLNKLAVEDRPAHDWYRFVLSFPPHLVRDCLHRFKVSSHQRVLDPFCGTGTTLVECQKLGIPSVGVEANPMALFASRTKVAWRIDPDGLVRHAVKVAEAALDELQADGIEDNPVFLRDGELPSSLRTLDSETLDLLLANSISPLPLHKTLVLLDVLRKHIDAKYENHERLALAKAVVFHISNLHFGPEVGVGPRKPDVPVIERWLACVRAMSRDIHELQKRRFAQADVHSGDARDLVGLLPPESIDAVITSPPYPNEKDYTRTTRLESVLLGFIKTKADLQGLKRSLVRSNTRGVYKGDDDDRWIMDHHEIQEIADAIETRRLQMGKTSGFERLYHRVTKLYFGGMARHLDQLKTVLRPGACLAYVVGDQASYLRVMIRTGELLGKIAQSLGFEFVGSHVFRTRLATATREQLKEEVVILRWPKKRSHPLKTSTRKAGAVR